MDENANPYKSPVAKIDLRIRRRQRRLMNFALGAAVAMVLFVVIWGLRFLFYVLNLWLFGPP